MLLNYADFSSLIPSVIATGEDTTNVFAILHSAVTSAIIDEDNFIDVTTGTGTYNSTIFIKNIVDIPTSSKYAETKIFGEGSSSGNPIADQWRQAFINAAEVVGRYEYLVREYPVSFVVTDTDEESSATLEIGDSDILYGYAEYGRLGDVKGKIGAIKEQTIDLIENADIVDITYRGETKTEGDFQVRMFTRKKQSKITISVVVSRKLETDEYFVFNGAVMILYRRKL